MSNQIRSGSDIEKFIKNGIKLGLHRDDIKRSLKSRVKDKGLLNSISIMVDHECDNHSSYKTIQKIMRSKIIIDKDSKDYRIVDLVDKNYSTISKENLQSIVSPKLDLDHKKYYCKFVYNPNDPFIIRESVVDGWEYNTYQPPGWMKDSFYSEGKVKVFKREDIPKIYKNFLMHLVNNDIDSYNYVLDWLAVSLKGRNYCILATIGRQGIGKGVLGNIMRGLVGRENFYAGSDKMFKNRFNSQIADKKIVYCDEISIKNKQDEDRLKLVVNDYLEVEKKHHDAAELKNYASFYISSNNIDSLRISASDRRFSVINLTEIPLIKIMNELKIKELLKEENIANLAEYLYYREVDLQKMLKVFVTERTEEVRAGSLLEWQDWFKRI